MSALPAEEEDGTRDDRRCEAGGVEGGGGGVVKRCVPFVVVIIVGGGEDGVMRSLMLISEARYLSGDGPGAGRSYSGVGDRCLLSGEDPCRVPCAWLRLVAPL